MTPENTAAMQAAAILQLRRGVQADIPFTRPTAFLLRVADPTLLAPEDIPDA